MWDRTMKSKIGKGLDLGLALIFSSYKLWVRLLGVDGDWQGVGKKIID